MFELALMVLARSGRTQFWLVMLMVFPFGILLLGLWLIPTDGVQQSIISRLVHRYEYAALVAALLCIEEAIRSYVKDWKRWG